MQSEKDPLVSGGSVVRLYKRRWYILFVYSFCAALNQMPCYQYTVISNIVVKYYNVPALDVDWTSILFMAIYIPLALPSAYIVDKWGLRASVLIGATGTFLGMLTNLLAFKRNFFWVVWLGQSILSTAQVPLLVASAQLVADWFGANELSTACAIAFLGPQLGAALGLVLPPTFVRNHDDADKIGNDLYCLNRALVAVAVLVMLAIIIYFPSVPPSPANLAQSDHNRKDKSYKQFFLFLKTLMCNRGFVLHSLAYSINTATVTAVTTLLNQLVLSYFPNSEREVGHLGLVMVVFGVCGSLLFGPLLDYTKKFKEVAIGVFTMTFFGVFMFMYSLLWKSKLFVYISSSIISFFPNAYMPIAYQLGIELTYPVPECTSSSVMFLLSQGYGVVCTLMFAKLFEVWGTFWSLLSQAVLLLLGIIFTILVPNALKRQQAFREYENNNNCSNVNNINDDKNVLSYS